MAKLPAATDATPEEIVRAMARQGRRAERAGSSGTPSRSLADNPFYQTFGSKVDMLRKRVAADLRDFEEVDQSVEGVVGQRVDAQNSQD